jgi:hypothetical protein
MSGERASIFGDEEADDLSIFRPKPPARVVEDPAAAAEKVRAVSETVDFRSRDPKPAPPRREQRRHRTGRNVQLNIKARAEAIEAFYAITDREKWVLGETFERAVEALKRELETSRS